MIFNSPSERQDYPSKDQQLVPEESKIKINLFVCFVEVRMPESFLHAQVGMAMGGCIIEQLAEQAYIAGTHPDDSEIITAGSPSISVFAVSLTF